MSMPIVKLEVDSMKHSILHAITQHHQEIEKVIEDKLAKIDIGTLVQDVIDKELPAAIEQTVRTAVRDAVSRAVASDMMFHSNLAKQVTQVIYDHIERKKTPL